VRAGGERLSRADPVEVGWHTHTGLPCATSGMNRQNYCKQRRLPDCGCGRQVIQALGIRHLFGDSGLGIPSDFRFRI
jgi:hypothetical protein